MAAIYPADTFQEGVDLTIEASNQLAQVVRGDANTEVMVADGSTIPSIRKAQTDSMYFKEPELWTTGQTETDYLQLKKYINPTTNKESWWFAKSATVFNPVAMGTSPFGDDNWTLYTPEDLFISGKAEYESVYQALKGKAAEAGYNLVRGSFEEGGTLTNINDVLWYQANGKYYNWYNGSAKTVVAGSTPATSGGVGAGAWVDRTDVTLRSDLASESGSGLVGYQPVGTGAVATTVQSKLREMVSVLDFGAVGDGVTDDTAAIQAAIDSGSLAISIPDGTYNLNSSTLSLVAGQQIHLDGGVLTNGTVACDGNFFFGARGLSSNITLTGTVANENGVFFDWFTCEKSTAAQYDTFINGNNATYGAIPTISATNRTILTMLFVAGYEVRFGAGIYPFDAALSITREFRIVGLDRSKTLLWAPNSSFITMSAGGATYPYMKRVSIEANNNVIYTKANTVNAIHGLLLYDSFFISYADHTFYNDITVAGGTGCPIYGSKILDCAVYAGPDKGCFTNWRSGSNIYDNVVDHFLFFNRRVTTKKGIAWSIFYNSNMLDYCNSNISYAGLKYVAYFDSANALFTFNAHNNVFEVNTNSFQAIVKAEAGTSNLNLDIGSNQYIGNVGKENGYAYILLLGNTYLRSNLDNVVLYGNTIRNYSAQYTRVVTTKTDTGATKYRLVYCEPYSSDETGNAGSSLMTPSADLASLVGMRLIYDADSANISYIQITSSRRSVNGSTLGARASGTTANRPTALIAPNFMYFDTTLSKPIWWNGSVWKDATGATV